MDKNIPEVRFDDFNDEWEQHKLGDVGKAQSGIGFPDSEQGGASGTPFYKVSDMNSLGNEYEMVVANNYVSDEQITLHKWKPITEVPALFFAKVGAAVMLNRKRLVRFPFLLDNNTMSYSLDKNEWDTSFSKALFDTLDLTSLVQVGALPSYNASDVESLEIALPSKEEQYSIGRFFDQLNNLIILHQRKYDKLVATKKSMLDKMFPKNGSSVPEIRFAGFDEPWKKHMFCDLFKEKREKTEKENEDSLLSCAISGVFLNAELFGHFRGNTTVGYLKIKKNDLILSAQNLHLGNANVNLRFEHGIISPAYKVFDIITSDPYFINTWVKKDNTKNFFLAATTEGASQCRKNIEWDTLDKQNVFVPSLPEQKLIGEFFKQLDNLISLQQQELEKLKNIKKALLDKMFV